MRDERLDMMFPETPQVFRDAMQRAAERLHERRVARPPMRAILIAALCVALIATAAVAASQWGVLELLRSGSFVPTQQAGAIVQSASGIAPVMVGDVKFEVTDTAYDGERIYLSLRVSAKDKPVTAGMGWGEPGEPGSLIARVQDVYLNGEWTSDYGETDGKQIDGAGVGMIDIPYKDANTSPEIRFDLSVYHQDTDTWDAGEMRFTLPLSTDSSRTLVMDTPIEMKGVNVTYIEMKYSPLKLYVTLRYTLDPNLPRFERLRREDMFFDLLGAGQALQSQNGRSRWLDELQCFETSFEYVATDVTVPALTVRLTGQDGEVYWERELNFQEVSK